MLFAEGLLAGLLGVDVDDVEEDGPGTGTVKEEPPVLTPDVGLPVFSPELVELPAIGPGRGGDESNENNFDGVFLGGGLGGVGAMYCCLTGKGESSRILTLRA